MDVLWWDLRHAFQRLLRQSGLSAIVILSVAAMISLVVVSLGIVEAVALRASAVKRPDRVFLMATRIGPAGPSQRFTGMSFADFEALQPLFASTSRGATLWSASATYVAASGNERSVNAASISPQYFDLASATFVAGHGGVATDLRSTTPYVVLTERIARTLGVRTGEIVRVNGVACDVVGIVRDFYGIHPGENIDLWYPIALIEAIAGLRGVITEAEYRPFASLIEVTDVANTSTSSLLSQRMREYVAGDGISFRLTPAQRSLWTLIREERTRLFMLPFIAMCIVLLVGLISITNIFVARSSARLPMFQVQTALGLPRWRLLYQSAAEPFVLTLLGGASGLGIGSALLLLCSRWQPLQTYRFAIRPGVAAITVGLIVSSAILVGFAATVVVRHIHLATGSTSFNATAGLRVGRLQRLLIALQFAIALSLSSIAIQMAVAANQEDRYASGINEDGVAAATVRLLDTKTPAAHGAAAELIFERVRGIPTVTAVAASSRLLFSTVGPARSLSTAPIASTGDKVMAHVEAVSPGYFGTLGIPIRHGRDFGAEDAPGNEAAVVINSALARDLRLDQPLGRVIYEGQRPMRIVGIAGDVRTSPDADIEPRFYLSSRQFPLPFLILYVRTTSSPQAIASSLRAALNMVDGRLGARTAITTLPEQRRSKLVLAETLAYIAAGIAAATLLLSALALFGLVSYVAQQRSREFAIRAAIGCSPSRLAWHILAPGLRMSAFGVAGGLVGLWMATMLTTWVLGKTSRLSLWTPVAMSTIYLITIATATLTTAMRAARTSPAAALQAH